MFELTLGQAILLYLQYFWEQYGLLALGLLLAGLALYARKRASDRVKKLWWPLVLVSGLCLCLVGGARLAIPHIQRARVNNGKALEVLDEAEEHFRLNGVTYQYLHLYNLTWSTSMGDPVYLDPKGRVDLYQAPNGPGLDLLAWGAHLYCPEDQVDAALAWYGDWDNFDVYMGDPSYQEGNLYNATVQALSPRPSGETLTALEEFSDAVEEEKAHHANGIIRGPREGSAVGIEVWPETDWETQQLYYRSHDGLVAIEGPVIYRIDDRLCIYAFDDWGYKNNIVIPLPDDLAACFLACWPATP